MPLNTAKPTTGHLHPLIANLSSHATLRPDDMARIESALGEAEILASLRDHERLGSAAATNCWCIASGWGGTVNLMADGRRQIVDLVLPGDVVEGAELHRLGLVFHAFTQVRLQDATSLARALSSEINGPPFQAWRAMLHAAAGRRVRHLVRLGGMMAYERVSDFLLELHDRERRAGISTQMASIMPLTQDALAEYMGLSGVHMNRILQQLRREGLIDYGLGRISVLHPERLESLVGRDARG